MIGEGSPKWELLQWVNKQIAPYNVDKPVVNFTTKYVFVLRSLRKENYFPFLFFVDTN